MMAFNIPTYNIVHNVNRVGGGGCKVVYQVENDKVAFIPHIIDFHGNLVSDQELTMMLKGWMRITNEEFFLSNMIRNLHIPTLQFDRCKVTVKDIIFDTFSSESFSSFVNDGLYVIDCKVSDSCYFSKHKKMNPLLSLFDMDSNRDVAS